VYLPHEHWLLLLDEAQRVDPAEAARLQSWSGRLTLESDVFDPPAPELERAVAFLWGLATHVESASPLVSEPSEAIPEDFTPEEHARMLVAVIAVLEEALRRGEPFRAWVA
jgi:hypothetical protein